MSDQKTYRLWKNGAETFNLKLSDKKSRSSYGFPNFLLTISQYSLIALCFFRHEPAWIEVHATNPETNFPLMLACETRILPGSIFSQWHPSLWWKLLNVRSLMVSLPLGVGRQHWTVLWRCIKLESSRSTTLKSWDTRRFRKMKVNYESVESDV